MNIRLIALLFAPALLVAQLAAPGFGLHNQRFVVKLLSPISTQTAREGDTFTASVNEPANFAGATIVGRIVKLKRPRKGVGKGKAEIKFQFESLSFAGRTEPVRTDLKEVQNSKGVKRVDEESEVIGVSSKRKRVLIAALMTGVGAGLGAATGGAQGAAIGAGSGLAAGVIIGLTMTASGGQIEFKPGSLFTLDISDGGRR